MLKGEGRDTGGKGNADALIIAQLESITAETTKCVVTTELKVTGKVAQFGRGIMGDVSEKLMTQFANNLNTMLDADEPAAATPAEAAPEAPKVRTIQGPAAEPIELSEFAGGAVLKRLAPFLGGLVILLLVLRRLRK